MTSNEAKAIHYDYVNSKVSMYWNKIKSKMKGMVLHNLQHKSNALHTHINMINSTVEVKERTQNGYYQYKI